MQRGNCSQSFGILMDTRDFPYTGDNPSRDGPVENRNQSVQTVLAVVSNPG
jgi:hypothetical protein